MRRKTLEVYLERYGVSIEDIQSLFLRKEIVREPGQELRADLDGNSLYTKQAGEGITLEPAIAGIEELQIAKQDLELLYPL